MPAENITITATWAINEYTITFDSAGGSTVDPIKQDYGTEVTAPAEPTKTGYTFDGWDKTIPTTMPAENITITAKWKINQYTIAFDSDGGSDVDSITQDYNTEVTAPAEPTKTGYTFDGWDKTIPTTMPAENITITAKWKINQYTIAFDSDGGSDVDSITQDYNTEVTAPAEPTREGYTFDGWDKTIPTTMPAENITITATWAINEYTITFDSAGGSTVDPIKQDYGTEVIAPAEPTREGYTFDGWDKDIPTTMPAENITITAAWTINEYDITYELNGGENHADNPNTYNVTSEITLEDPTKEGYIFDGWAPSGSITAGTIGDKFFEAVWNSTTYTQYNITYTLNGGTNHASNPNTYNVTSEITLEAPTKEGYIFDGWAPSGSITAGMTGDKSFEAVWNSTIYTQYNITFKGLEAGDDNPNNLTFTVKDLNVVLKDAVREGYTFDGWFDEEEGGTEVTEITELGDVELWARFTPIDYDITFKGLEAEDVNPNDLTFTIEDLPHTLLPAEREGYTFDGWFDEEEGGMKVTEITDIGDVELWAKFSINTYTIDFKGLEEDDVNPNNPAFTIKDLPAVLKDAEREGYTFVGWFDSETNGTKITEIDHIGDVSIWARFEINKFTVQFLHENGTKLDSQQVNYKNTATVPEDPIKSGYYVRGWNNTTGDGKIYSKDIINETPVTEDTIYQVVFKEKSGGGTGNGTIIDPSEPNPNPSEPGPNPNPSEPGPNPSEPGPNPSEPGLNPNPSESERNPSENGEDGSQSSGSVSGGSQSSGSASNGSQSSGSGSTTDPLKPGMAGAGGTTLLFPLAIAFFLFYVKREGDLD